MNPIPAGSLLDRVAELGAENARLREIVPSDCAVVPRSLIVDVMCCGEDGVILEQWMVDKLESALLGAFPSSTRDGHDNNTQQGEEYDAR
jgi:hypothetical protein